MDDPPMTLHGSLGLWKVEGQPHLGPLGYGIGHQDTDAPGRDINRRSDAIDDDPALNTPVFAALGLNHGLGSSQNPGSQTSQAHSANRLAALPLKRVKQVDVAR